MVEELPMTNSISTSNTIFLCVGGGYQPPHRRWQRRQPCDKLEAFLPVVQTNIDGTQATTLANTISVVWNSLPAPTANELSAAFAGIDQRME